MFNVPNAQDFFSSLLRPWNRMWGMWDPRSRFVKTIWTNSFLLFHPLVPPFPIPFPFPSEKETLSLSLSAGGETGTSSSAYLLSPCDWYVCTSKLCGMEEKRKKKTRSFFSIALMGIIWTIGTNGCLALLAVCGVCAERLMAEREWNVYWESTWLVTVIT